MTQSNLLCISYKQPFLTEIHLALSFKLSWFYFFKCFMCLRHEPCKGTVCRNSKTFDKNEFSRWKTKSCQHQTRIGGNILNIATCFAKCQNVCFQICNRFSTCFRDKVKKLFFKEKQRLWTYSCVPNKRAGHNKRAGWKMGQNQINVQGQINVQAGKMLNLDKLVG